MKRLAIIRKGSLYHVQYSSIWKNIPRWVVPTPDPEWDWTVLGFSYKNEDLLFVEFKEYYKRCTQ